MQRISEMPPSQAVIPVTVTLVPGHHMRVTLEAFWSRELEQVLVRAAGTQALIHPTTVFLVYALFEASSWLARWGLSS